MAVLMTTLLVVGTSLALTAVPAAAHTDFLGAAPADGTTLADVPAELVLEFSDDMDPQFSSVNVQVDGGSSTPLQVTGGANRTELVAAIPETLAPREGSTTRWTATFRVVSRDGHPVVGSTQFVVRLPRPSSTASPSPTSAKDPSPGSTPSPANGEVHAVERKLSDEPARDAPGDRQTWPLVALGLGVLLLLAGAVGAAMRFVGRDADK